jgi:hypothetical protein
VNTTTEKPQTAAEVRALAESWYQQQVTRIALCMGTNWPAHREWVESYLAEEVRQKLIARGWRPKA